MRRLRPLGLLLSGTDFFVGMYFKTPLRYPGGKGKLTDFIKLVLVQNDLVSGEYCEPYAGGAGIAINLLLDGYVRHAHLNDLNFSVFSFWIAVFNSPEEFCRKISATPVTMQEWHRQKAVQLNPTTHSPFDVGFSTFFLNRTNRSGIIRGGVVGGNDQSGIWKLDARFNKPELIARVQGLAAYRQHVTMHNLDAAELILRVLPTLPRDALVYLDPPYYVKGAGLYENHYSHADHSKIAKLVQTKIKQPWIVSYDQAAEILCLYRQSRSISYGVSYSAQDRYRGSEAMFFSRNLSIPDVGDPKILRAA